MEEEAAKRIELLVKKRVEEQLEKRREEIEQEVIKRVNAAKAVMEQEMMMELAKRREQIREEERRHEVGGTISNSPKTILLNPSAMITNIIYYVNKLNVQSRFIYLKLYNELKMK